MKFLYTTVVCMSLALGAYAQTVATGNGRAGYGGALGGGVLTITESSTVANLLDLKLQKGTGALNDAVVIYLDTKPGGFTGTSQFTDEADGLRRAISGVQGGDRATLNMPDGFKPEYAIAFNDGFAGVWELKENEEHRYITSANLQPTGNKDASEFALSVQRNDIGLNATDGFRFLATYVSETGYRSNEFIGDPGPAENPQNGSYTASAFAVHGVPLSVSFIDVQTRISSNLIQVGWKVDDEKNADRYIVERSGNGSQFESVGSVAAGNMKEYSFTDYSPANGNNFYRIMFQSRDGVKMYSKTVLAKFAGRDVLKAFASYGKVTAQVELNQTGNYRLDIVNSIGQPVYKEEIRYDGTSNTFDIILNNPLPTGIYSIMLSGNGINLSRQLLVK